MRLRPLFSLFTSFAECFLSFLSRPSFSLSLSLFLSLSLSLPISISICMLFILHFNALPTPSPHSYLANGVLSVVNRASPFFQDPSSYHPFVYNGAGTATFCNGENGGLGSPPSTFSYNLLPPTQLPPLTPAAAAAAVDCGSSRGGLWFPPSPAALAPPSSPWSSSPSPLNPDGGFVPQDIYSTAGGGGNFHFIPGGDEHVRRSSFPLGAL